MSNDKYFDERVRMSEEDYILLQKPAYDKMMNNVIKYAVVRSMKPSELNDIRGVYERLGYKLTNPNCSSCVFNMVERIARHYFAAMEIRTKKEIRHKDSKTIQSNRQKARVNKAIKNAKTSEESDGSTGQPSQSVD